MFNCFILHELWSNAKSNQKFKHVFRAASISVERASCQYLSIGKGVWRTTRSSCLRVDRRCCFSYFHDTRKKDSILCRLLYLVQHTTHKKQAGAGSFRTFVIHAKQKSILHVVLLHPPHTAHNNATLQSLKFTIEQPLRGSWRFQRQCWADRRNVPEKLSFVFYVGSWLHVDRDHTLSSFNHFHKQKARATTHVFKALSVSVQLWFRVACVCTWRTRSQPLQTRPE